MDVELGRDRSPLKILCEDDVAQMLEHGLIEPYSDNPASISVIRECFLNPSKSKISAKMPTDDALKGGVFLTSLTGQTYVLRFDSEIGDDPELNAESIGHEIIHQILLRWKKRKTCIALDNPLIHDLTLPKSSRNIEYSIQFELQESHSRLMNRQRNSFEKTLKRYKTEGSY